MSLWQRFNSWWDRQWFYVVLLGISALPLVFHFEWAAVEEAQAGDRLTLMGEQASSTDLVVCARGLPTAEETAPVWSVAWRVWPNSMGYDSFLLDTHTDQGACGTIDLSREVNSTFSLRLQGPYRLGSSLDADQWEPGAKLVAGFKVHVPGPEPGYIDLHPLDTELVGEHGQPSYTLPISLWEGHVPQGLTVVVPSGL